MLLHYQLGVSGTKLFYLCFYQTFNEPINASTINSGSEKKANPGKYEISDENCIVSIPQVIQISNEYKVVVELSYANVI